MSSDVIINTKEILRNFIYSRNEEFTLRGEKFGLPDFKLPLFKVKYIQSEKNICYAFLINSEKEKMFLPISIGDLESLLLNFGFLRIHKSYIVNVSYINFLLTNYQEVITLTSGEVLPLAKRRRVSIISIIKKLNLNFPKKLN